MDYALRLKVLRAARGMSQASLAEISEISNFDLSKIETGKMLPSPDWEARIRAALGWTPAVDSALDALAAALAETEAEPVLAERDVA